MSQTGIESIVLFTIESTWGNSDVEKEKKWQNAAPGGESFSLAL